MKNEAVQKIRSCTNSPKCPNCEADFFADDEKIRRKTSVERLLVQLLTSLLTAVFLAGVLALPPTANPAFAESNVTSGENDAASSINENYIPPILRIMCGGQAPLSLPKTAVTT